MRASQQQQPTPNDLSGGGTERRMSFGSEIALQHGVHFDAKFIGSMEITRPGTRIEIVAAMRRVRFEMKARNSKKKPVDFVVSVDGIKVVLQRRKKRKKFMDESKLLIMSHPMYRVYYVAHDLYDPQIFSYVARDGASNSFKCNVFKCSERDQAIAVVRTIGQAFELCNRMSAEQTRERQLLEEERAVDAAIGTSADVAGPSSSGTGRRRSDREERESRSSSTTGRQSPAPGGAKRHSIFLPKRANEAGEEETENDGEEIGENEEYNDYEEEERIGAQRAKDSYDVYPGPSTSSARPSMANIHQPEAMVVTGQMGGPPGTLQLSIPAEPLPPQQPQYASQQPQPMVHFQQGAAAATNPAIAHFPGAQQATAALWNIPVQQHTALFGTPSQLVHYAHGAPDPTGHHQALGTPVYSIVPPAMSIASPLLISPYATLQLPPTAAAATAASLPSTSSEQLSAATVPPLLAGDQLQSPANSETQRLARSQLDQAQHSAQVSACQVQLLRDQLAMETTVRLEAQSNTYQLLNSNRELLDQVQQLVSRLQVMENRMSAGLMNHLGATSAGHHHHNDVRAVGGHREKSPPARGSAHRGSLTRTHKVDEAEPSTSSTAAKIGQLRPYQMRALADMRRTSSLDRADKEATKRRDRDGSGEDSEEDSDLLDSSEAHSAHLAAAPQHQLPRASIASGSILRKLVPSLPAASSGATVGGTSSSSSFGLIGAGLGMPLLFGQQMMHRSAAAATNPGRRKESRATMSLAESHPRPPNDVNQQATSSTKALRRFSLASDVDDYSQPKVHAQQRKPPISKGVFGKMEFKRMSFNTNPNKKTTEDRSLINVPPINETGENEEYFSTERRNSRTSPDKQQQKRSSSPERQRRRSSASGALSSKK